MRRKFKNYAHNFADYEQGVHTFMLILARYIIRNCCILLPMTFWQHDKQFCILRTSHVKSACYNTH